MSSLSVEPSSAALLRIFSQPLIIFVAECSSLGRIRPIKSALPRSLSPLFVSNSLRQLIFSCLSLELNSYGLRGSDSARTSRSAFGKNDICCWRAGESVQQE